MADQVCAQELNAQLQTLQGRLKALEEQVASIQEVQLTDIGQTCAGFIALISTGGVGGLPTYIANQVILQIAAAALGETAEALEGIGGPVGDFASDIAGMADTVKELVAALITGKLLDWESIQFELMIPYLAQLPYLGAMVTGVLDAAETALDAAEEALQLDPLNAELQAAYTAALNFRDSVNSASSAMNNLSLCKTASKLFGA